MALKILDHEYLKEIEKARRELRFLIYKQTCASLMLRLAWQDACTYDRESKIKGGSNGSIRSELELRRPENKGLEKAVQLCEEVKAKLKKVSYADLYQLAGVVAVEITGGPIIDFVPGRMDFDEPPQEGRLPDPNEEGICHLRDIFTTRMGLSDQDIVALSGGHTLDQVHKENNIDKEKSEKDEAHKENNVKWTSTPFKFDNSYFLLLPTDNALSKDTKFKEYVRKYAKDKDAFFKDYAAAHKKLSELGCNLMSPFTFSKAQREKLKLIKPKGVIGIVVVSGVILGYLRKRKVNQPKT